MKVVLFVWKDGVIERFGRLGDALRLLGHDAVLALHPRSEAPVAYEGQVVEAEGLTGLLDRHAPDCVVLWNGDLPQDDAVKAECRA
ncbi:MAG: hypothetical protein NUW21_10255, partial [Elusimicrobia bacterium]|nr:hypothetical protein [Elusimicrobiota bacterium]